MGWMSSIGMTCLSFLYLVMTSRLPVTLSNRLRQIHRLFLRRNHPAEVQIPTR